MLKGKSGNYMVELFLCWSFYCVNDNAKVGLVNPQIMRCIFCYQNPIIGINPRTQARK
jgi:hypothetical protein